MMFATGGDVPSCEVRMLMNADVVRVLSTRSNRRRGRGAFVLSLALATLGLGCASLSPLDPAAAPRLADTLSSNGGWSVSAAPADSPRERDAGRNWAALSRHGRHAMQTKRFRQAEMHFRGALHALARVSPRDARSHALMGNLARLASIYKRLGQDEDAKRVMSLVDIHVERQGLTIYGSSNYHRLYAELVQQPIPRRYLPPEPVTAPKKKGIDGLIERTARSHSVDPALVKAVVKAESNFEPLAVSHAGAQGLMQLMPETAREMGVRAPFNPQDNIEGGVRYLRRMLDRYGELTQALAAYNAGPTAVDQYGGIPPYPETQQYVERVLDFYRDYRQQFTR